MAAKQDTKQTSKSSAALYDIVFIDDELVLNQSVSELKSVNGEAFLAVDCEGFGLGRNGTLDILSIATKEKAYLFDVNILGKSVFDSGIRQILNDPARQKLMFDCRQDADILQHQYQVQLDGVVDLQLLEILHRRTLNPRKSLPSKTNHNKYWNAVMDSVERLNGYQKCIEIYIKDEELLGKKEKGSELMKEVDRVWGTRPLPRLLINYCCADTIGLFKLYDVLTEKDKHTSIVRVASARYADYFRSLTKPLDNSYGCHAFLPHNIIPEDESLRFPHGNRYCTGCTRIFSKEEFSKTQLRRGTQQCRVCRKVKNIEDVEENRIDNWALQDSEEYCGYESDHYEFDRYESDME